METDPPDARADHAGRIVTIDGGSSRDAKRIRMRLNWSTQFTPVLGSFTAGEIAFSAISTICKTPNSTSCCSVRVGPSSSAEYLALSVVVSRSPL